MRSESIEINVVGSSTFGVYPKISIEKTVNQFISDGWMVDYPGYAKKLTVGDNAEGRAAFYSERGDFTIIVVGTAVYKIISDLTQEFVGQISSTTGEISIDENQNGQIAICDGVTIYIYNDDLGSFVEQTQLLAPQPAGFGVGYIPGYIFFHNTYFIVCSSEDGANSQFWFVCKAATDLTLIDRIELVSFSISTKPNAVIAGCRIPGGGNNILMLGESVGEIWTQVADNAVYRRVQSFNLDNGIASISTLDKDNRHIMWLARNEKNRYFLNLMVGNDWKSVDTDGIEHVLQNLKNPEKSTAFFHQVDNHLFYQITFFDERDNLSIFYDVKENAFYHTMDELENYHPARQLVSFGNKAYFVSINDGGFYEMSTNYTTYNYEISVNCDGEDSNDDDKGEVIPRIRVCKAVRKSDASIMRGIKFGFWLEQGFTSFPKAWVDGLVCFGAIITEEGDGYVLAEDGTILLLEDGYCTLNPGRPSVDMSISKNGGVSFSNIVRRQLNPQGVHRNQITWNEFGHFNELVIKLRYVGLNRFVCGPGVLEVGI